MTEQWIPDPELPRRIAAALTAAGKKPVDVAPELNVSARTLERVMSGDRLAREWEVHRLAAILDVPLWFLLEGWAGAERPTDDDRLSELLRQLLDLDRKLDRLDVSDRLAAIEGELRALVGGRLRDARGAVDE